MRKGLCGCFEWEKVPCFCVAEHSIWDQFYVIVPKVALMGWYAGGRSASKLKVLTVKKHIIKVIS